MLRNFFFIFIFLPIRFLAQEPGITREELKWAFFHPFAAVKVKLITRKCTHLIKTDTVKMLLDNFSNGGKLDAFRHVFFMAAYAKKIAPRKVEKLGIAHEKANFRQFQKGKLEEGELPDSLSTVMDLYNNKVGIGFGRQNRWMLFEQLLYFSIHRINQGDALIMKRNRSGQFVTCTGEILDRFATGKKWSIPKCLLRSNENYNN